MPGTVVGAGDTTVSKQNYLSLGTNILVGRESERKKSSVLLNKVEQEVLRRDKCSY